MKPDYDDGLKYSLSQDPEDLMEVEITDEDGNTRNAYVCRIVAERDLKTTGPGGEEVLVAAKGDKGGYVECDVELDGDGTPHPVLPVRANEHGTPSDKYEGGLKGLSQLDDSWVHAGSVLAGEASVRDDAQIVGPDTLITGADVYKDNVGAGGSHYRSTGRNEFSGKGSYIDMELDVGSEYTFSGGTQVGGPVRFEAGKGEFCDSPDGRGTMLFAAEEGSALTVRTEEGFRSNGLTALDNTVLAGSFEGNRDLIVQNSEIDVQGTKFTGPVTMVNQQLGPAANGMELATDADVGFVSLAPMAGIESMTDEEYRAHIDNVLAHELGENFGDTVVQNHQGDIHDKMHSGLLDSWDRMPEDMTPGEFYEADRTGSEYQAGVNDAPTEDQRELMAATGMTMDEIDAALTGQDGGRKIAARDAWQRFSQVRGDHQPEGHQNLTSGYSQRELGGDGGELNPNASEGLLADEATELTDKPANTRKGTTVRNLGSLEEIAKRAKYAEGKGKDDGPEVG